MQKCVGFKSDEAATMLGHRSSVETIFKKVNSFVTSTHRINLVAFEAIKSSECKSLCTKIDVIHL